MQAQGGWLPSLDILAGTNAADGSWGKWPLYFIDPFIDPFNFLSHTMHLERSFSPPAWD